MPIYALGDDVPDIHPDAYVHPDAVLIGAVRVGAGSSIWPGAVLRGDGGGHIAVGERSSVQDNCVLHTTPEHPTVVGDDCVIGHIVHLEGCTIGPGALVGTGAVVLNGTEVPPGALAVGAPATIKAGGAKADAITHGRDVYVEKARAYRDGLRRIG